MYVREFRFTWVPRLGKEIYLCIVGFILKPSISEIVKNRDICTIGELNWYIIISQQKLSLISVIGPLKLPGNYLVWVGRREIQGGSEGKSHLKTVYVCTLPHDRDRSVDYISLHIMSHRPCCAVTVPVSLVRRQFLVLIYFHIL